ncbi:MAG: hypothetical protein JXR71_06975 [Bacteroidales bacterium]|nr:hypothetical protein [Bacteroidales bacterium]
MKRKQILYAALVVLAVGLFACQKQNTAATPTTSGPSSLDLKLQAVNPSFTLKSAMANSPAISWDSASMVVSMVKFEASLKSSVSEKDSIEIEYKWRGPQTVNLLDTTATFGNFSLQPGYYDQVELKVSGLSDDAAGRPVFYLHGIYAENDTTSLPIVVKSYQNVLFKTESDSVHVDSTSASAITSYIQIYLDQLMTNVQALDLNNADLTNGTLVISDSTNTEIYNAIMRNLGEDHHCYYRHENENENGDKGDKGGDSEGGN